MINRWERGRECVDELLREQRLTKVPANRDLAVGYLAQARAHLIAAAAVIDLDATGAFALAYDAARLALAAVLVNQGLRPRGDGAHAVLLQAVLAQLEPPRQEQFREFDWMRRLRNDSQYPDADHPVAVAEDVAEAVPAAREIVDRAEQLLDAMPPY